MLPNSASKFKYIEERAVLDKEVHLFLKAELSLSCQAIHVPTPSTALLKTIQQNLNSMLPVV